MHLWGILTIIIIFIFAEEILHMFFGPLAELVALYVGLSLLVLLLKLSVIPILAAWDYIASILGPTAAHFISEAVVLFIVLVLPYLLLADALRDFKFIKWAFRSVFRRRRVA